MSRYYRITPAKFMSVLRMLSKRELTYAEIARLSGLSLGTIRRIREGIHQKRFEIVNSLSVSERESLGTFSQLPERPRRRLDDL